MSELKDHNDPVQDMPELPSNEHIGADAEDEDLQSLLQNPVDEQNSQFQTEVNFINDSRFSANPLEPDSAEQNIRETAIPSELQNGAEVPISRNQIDDDTEKPGDEVPVSMNQTENDSERPGDEVPVFMNQTANDSEKPGVEVPVSMNRTENDSEKPRDEITVFMNQTESDSEKTGGEVPAFRNQTESGSEKTGDELHAFMNQSQSDSEKTGDGDPVSLNQRENNSEKTSDEVPFFMNRMEDDSERNDALDVKNEMESEMVNTSLEDGSNSLESDVKAAHSEDNYSTETPLKQERAEGEQPAPIESSNQSFTFDYFLDGDDSGSEEEQAAFMKELENFFRERSMEFKPPKFYGEGLNCLKLWRAVTKLGGYDRVTSCKLWRQVGESFKPPKTCTTVSWSFRGFYEKALLEYEKHKIRTGELQIPISDLPEAMVIDNQPTEPVGTKIEYPHFQLVFNFEEVERPSGLHGYITLFAYTQIILEGTLGGSFQINTSKGGGNQASGSGRARRDAAARAMQGWHSQRLLGHGEVGDPIIKDKSSISLLKRDKHLKSNGAHKRKKPSNLEPEAKVGRTKDIQTQGDTTVVDVGAPADWVKINVRQTKDCFEVYALVPGLLREEVQVQSDPAGRLIISGEPEQPDNPWGVTPFKKVITLPSRIDPHQTSAVVTLHGQLFVRAPFDQSDL